MSSAFFVAGTPAPQGSKRGFYNKKAGRVVMVESSDKVKPWRQAVSAEAISQRNKGLEPIAGAVAVAITFLLSRPKGHYGTGRNAGRLRPSAPKRPAVRPDLDKLARSTLDGLDDAGLFEDDSRIVSLILDKRYADSRTPITGARIVLSSPF